ncbi:MAG TPA: YqaJ viral recombinase family protein [bacterium]|nr:YqaJ viral recombinase family protein [bacterium]
MTYRIIRCLDKADWLERRKAVVTSTEISALFGCNPYLTAAQLWAQKKSLIFPERRVSPAMQAGLDLEASIAQRVARAKGWDAKPFPTWMFAQRDDYRAGSSFDWAVKDQWGVCPLEVKKIHWGAMGKYWRCEGNRVTQTSDYVKLQLQYQMWICGFPRIKLAVLCGEGWYLWGEFLPDPFIQRQFEDKLTAFWASQAKGIPPEGATRTRVWRLYLAQKTAQKVA